jgi:hypothetical protein
MEALVIEHCQKHVAIFRYCLEDEMPHDSFSRTRWQGCVDLGQIGNGPFGFAGTGAATHAVVCAQRRRVSSSLIFDLTQCCVSG